MSKTEWKHLVKRHINMREKHVLQASCLLYSRLVYHQSVNDIRMWPWWTYSLDNPRHTSSSSKFESNISGQVGDSAVAVLLSFPGNSA